MFERQDGRKSVLMAALAAWVVAFPARAGDPVLPLKAAPSGQPEASLAAYEWYDGVQRRVVYLNPQLVLELSPAAPSHSSVRAIDPGATLVVSTKGPKLWKLSAGSAQSATRALRSSGARVAPVFHDGPGPEARRRAPAGNVIVQLDPSWDEAAVRAWVKRSGVELAGRLAFGTNLVFVKAPASLEAIRVANALVRSGEVRAAYPNWWEELTVR